MRSLEHVVDEKGKLLKYCEVGQEERKAPKEKSLRTAEQFHADLAIGIRQWDRDADREMSWQSCTRQDEQFKEI